MRDLASPVGAFVREMCELGPEIAVEELYVAYKAWCEAGENTKLSEEQFGTNLRAACPSVRKIRPRGAVRTTGTRDTRPRSGHASAGICLSAEAAHDKADDEITRARNALVTRTTGTTKPAAGPGGPSDNALSRT
jgi:phage/plasmid-associated DNA primase